MNREFCCMFSAWHIEHKIYYALPEAEMPKDMRN